jgi:uncharacterized protein YciI
VRQDALVLHVLILRYTESDAEAEPHVPDHVEFLQRHHAGGTFVFSGQTVPQEIGGVILAIGLDRLAVEKVAATDPLVMAGVGSYEIITVAPDRVHSDLAEVLGMPAVADSGWDTESFNMMNNGRQVLSLLAAREMEPVLQHAGQALLAELASNAATAAPYARRCVQHLQDRLWEGDEQLAAELRHALGEQVSAGEYGIPAWPLETAPVNLSDLADGLDGDPGQGTGVVDLQTGMILPAGITDYDPPDELNEDSDEYDEDRWLYYRPESGEAYRDMLRFSDHITSEQLRLRLLDALDGRGAFRRFRDIVFNGPADVLTHWQIYRQERALGRAREWLASEGYRSAPTGRPLTLLPPDGGPPAG